MMSMGLQNNSPCRSVGEISYMCQYNVLRLRLNMSYLNNQKFYKCLDSCGT